MDKEDAQVEEKIEATEAALEEKAQKVSDIYESVIINYTGSVEFPLEKIKEQIEVVEKSASIDYSINEGNPDDIKVKMAQGLKEEIEKGLIFLDSSLIATLAGGEFYAVPLPGGVRVFNIESGKLGAEMTFKLTEDEKNKIIESGEKEIKEISQKLEEEDLTILDDNAYRAELFQISSGIDIIKL